MHCTTRTLALTLIALSHVALLHAQLVINEVCSSNHRVLLDFEGEPHDFIELLNLGALPVQLSEYRLQDNQDWRVWPLPDVWLNSGEFILIFASGKDLYSPEYHANFSIDKDGEELYLLHATETQYVDVPALHTDHSYGRIPSSGEYRFFDEPTPGQPNANDGYLGYSFAPQLSHGSGVYPDGLMLTASTIAEQSVHYASGGHSPYTHGESVDAPIAIHENTVLQFICKRNGYLPSQIIHRTFFVTPPPDLPIVSLIVAPDTLFHHESGLFMPGLNADEEWPFYGANFWENRYIEVHLDYFTRHTLRFSQRCDLRIHGDKGTRTQEQRPMRLVARNRHGAGEFMANLIDGKPHVRYKSVVLRNSGGDWSRVHLTDAFIQQTVTDPLLHTDTRGSTHAVVYINGSFFGLYDFQQHINARYTRHAFNTHDSTSVAILKHENEADEGDFSEFDTLVDWFESTDLSTDSNFNEAAALLDLDNFTDYLITAFFWNNTDWPANNLRCHKANIPEAKWRWITYDFDVSMNSVGWVTEHTDNLNRVLTDFQHIKTVKLFVALLANTQYRHRFINRYADLVNTTFASERLTERFNALVDRVQPAMDLHFERWGSNADWWHFFWLQPRAFVFLAERPAIAIDQLQAQFNLAGQYRLAIDSWPPNAASFTLNSLVVDETEWQGTYFTDVPIALEAVARDGYRFVHWKIAGSDSIVSSTPSIQQSFSESVHLTAVYRPDDRGHQLVLHPNPSVGSLHLRHYSEVERAATCRIFAANGQMVSESSLALHAGINRWTFDKPLPAGIYVIELRYPGAVHRARWVKAG